MSTVRFVILQHRPDGGEHWDLMIEQPETLATWQLSRNPLDHPGETIPARRIGDHRKVYLDYEGPVSGDRGTVRRIEAGACTVEEAGAAAWRVTLAGRRLIGAFELIRSGAGVEESNAPEPNETPWVFRPGGHRGGGLYDAPTASYNTPMNATIEVGQWRIRSVINGHLRLDGGAMFGVVPKPLWSKVAPADELNRITLAMRTLVATHRAAGRIVLVDTGAGTKWPADKAARYAIETIPQAIDDALKELGATRDDVTDVVATHLHFDHCGGMTEWAGAPDGPTQLRFPQAKHWIHERHWAHAHHPTLRDRASFLPVDFAILEETGGLQLVADADALSGIDDLRWITSSGHTPFQLLPFFSAGGAGRDLLFIGDMVPTANHLPPAWVMAYDLEPLTTLAERAGTYSRCREEGFLLAFPHDPEHGIVSLAFDGDKPRVAQRWG